MKDKQGREYANITDLKVGDIVTVDGDCACIKPWSQLEVKDGYRVDCSGRGGHYLRAHLAGDWLVGIYKGKVVP